MGEGPILGVEEDEDEEVEEAEEAPALLLPGGGPDFLPGQGWSGGWPGLPWPFTPFPGGTTGVRGLLMGGGP